jgi:hypothetical protein
LGTTADVPYLVQIFAGLLNKVAVSRTVNEPNDLRVKYPSKPLWKNWPFRITFIVMMLALAFCVYKVMSLERQHPGALKADVENRISIH